MLPLSHGQSRTLELENENAEFRQQQRQFAMHKRVAENSRKKLEDLHLQVLNSPPDAGHCSLTSPVERWRS
jgi:hypothetical protein